jgi:DNA-binding IclR family transcriptional regulator
MTVEKGSEGRSGTQAIERALRVLDTFGHAGPELTVSQVAFRVALPVSTTHRILQALTRGGYLHHSRGSYNVSSRVEALARAAAPLDTQDAAPYLYALAAGLKCTVTLGVRDLGRVRTLVTARPAAQWVGAAQIPAPWESLHASALGKAILAFASNDLRGAVEGLGALEAFTLHTQTSADRLVGDLDLVRNVGFAIADEERTVGVRAVAVPVYASDRKVVGALGVQDMAQRFTNQKVRELAVVLRQAAQEIGVRLARPGGPAPMLDRDGSNPRRERNSTMWHLP